MKQEDKDLLLRDLCARLPYGVRVYMEDNLKYTVIPCKNINLEAITEFDRFAKGCLKVNHLTYRTIVSHKEDIILKPYLRPMSNMTREEWEEYDKIKTGACYFGSSYTYLDMYDWLLAHHFDYRGLIEKGLALEAPEGMYDLNKE